MITYKVLTIKMAIRQGEVFCCHERMGVYRDERTDGRVKKKPGMCNAHTRPRQRGQSRTLTDKGNKI
jgi:hypothetical protein